VINSGGRDYTVHRAPSTAEGVRQVLLELPPLRFDETSLPEPFERFTAVAVPNPHVIAVVEEYSEPDLIELGQRADQVFAEGANVSFLQQLDDTGGGAPEVFVRTFERGAGLTPSCGSGVVASRAAYSRVSGLDPERRVVVRNAGGVAAASIQVRDGAWYPILEGNATVVYRAEVDLAGDQAGPLEFSAEENSAYAALDERNTARLKLHGIETAHP
jgi:diaminopimelate epimerase